MSKKIGITLLCLLILMVGLAYAGYERHQETSSYKYRAKAYMKKFDPSTTFEYVDEIHEPWQMLVGVIITVHFRDVKTGEIVGVGFHNGRLMPMVKFDPSLSLSDYPLSFDVEEKGDSLVKIISLLLYCLFLATLCLAFVGYDQHRRTNTYKNKALAYMRKSAPSMTFEYLDETPERKPDWFNGIVATVFIKNVSTGTIWAVEFLNNKVDYERKVDSYTPTLGESNEK
ncbi:hypothetical protein D3C75_587210 [compost metagenome]